MSINNWGVINNGGVFESLMHAILYAENQSVSLFCRPGKDSAIDAKSADGTCIYQAKYRKDMSMDNAIELAKSELEKIKGLRTEKNVHWNNAKKWILFANFEKNPNDEKKWQDEVIPLFKHIGLDAYFRDIENMDQSLIYFPHIKDSFFGGKNRAFVSALEAKYISIAKGVYFDNPILGRETEFVKVGNFLNENTSSILKVSGSSGIGKTRFLHYTSEICSKYGYIPIWGLSNSLKYSDSWFKTYNVSDKICLIIDDMADVDLLLALIEQLNLPERKKWKMVFSAMPSFVNKVNSIIKSNTDLISLSSLNESDSKQLFKDINFATNEEHIRYECAKLSAGIPSNIFLIKEMFFQEGKYTAEFLDRSLTAVIDSALNEFESPIKKDAERFLRYIALWGDVNLEDESVKEFLSSKDLKLELLQNIKKALEKNKLIRLWGYEERFCKISSTMLRDTIISMWLMSKDSLGNYYITDAGKNVLEEVYNGNFPLDEVALSTLGEIFILRKIDHNPFIDLYKEIEEKIKSQGITVQLSLLKKLSKVIFADVDHSLDILSEARKNYRKEIPFGKEVPPNYSPFGDTEFAIIPSLLLKLLERAENKNFARNILNELSYFITLNPSTFTFNRNINNENLSKSISRISGNYIEPFVLHAAVEYIKDDLSKNKLSDISIVLAKAILRPKIELPFRMTSRYTGEFGYTYIPSKSFTWEKIIELKELFFTELKNITEPRLRMKIWDIIDSFHSYLDRTIIIDKRSDESYLAMRDDNLAQIKALLLQQKQSENLTIKEASAARKVWDWYFYREDLPELQKIATELDNIISDISKWDLKGIFKLRTSKDSRLELEKCANELDEIVDVAEIDCFFKEVKDYLDSIDKGMHSFALDDIVKEMKSTFSGENNSALDKFIFNRLSCDKDANTYAWNFAIRFLEDYILKSKNIKSSDYIQCIKRLLSLNPKNAESILFDLYGNAHPQRIGELKIEELNLLMENKEKLQLSTYFWMLTAFSVFSWDKIVNELENIIESCLLDEKDTYLKKFIRAYDFISLRYNTPVPQKVIEFVISNIKKCNLDANILKSYELERLRDVSGYRMPLAELLNFIKIRVENERNKVPKPVNSHLLPYDLSIKKWVKFDPTSQDDKDAFKSLCDLMFENVWYYSYYIPEYIADIDKDAVLLPNYLNDALSTSSDDEERVKHCAVLISKYEYASNSWVKCAKSILQLIKSYSSRKKERFFHLMQDSFKSYSTVAGTVAECFYKDVNLAQERYDKESDSCLKEYFEWDLSRAKDALKFEETRMETLNDD